jgi:hypothetical protein
MGTVKAPRLDDTREPVERRMHLYWATRECFICTQKAASKRFGPCEHREFEVAAAWAERMGKCTTSS